MAPLEKFIIKEKGKNSLFVALRLNFPYQNNVKKKRKILNQCKMAADMLAMLLVPWRVFADLKKSQLAI